MEKSSVIMKARNFFFVKQVLNFAKFIVILALITVILQGCSVKKPLMSTGIVNKVALISTTLNCQVPTGIAAYQAIARTQFKNQAAEINAIMSNYVDTLHQAVASNLKTQLGCEVLYGRELHTLPQYSEISKKYELSAALNKEDEKFPEVLISSGDNNFIIEETKSNLYWGGGTFLLKPVELKATIINLCRELNIDHIAFAQFIFNGYRTDIIFPTNTNFIYYLYLYNKEGDCIATSYNAEKTSKLLENDIPSSLSNMIKTYLNKSEMIGLKSAFDKK
jgi:hypothetical protein